MRDDPLRALVALFSVAALLVPGAAATDGLSARIDSLRSLEVTIEGRTVPTEAPLWRAQLDGDASGTVSTQELSTFVSVVEHLITHPETELLEAYNLTWSAENASGAAPFTLDGRANFAVFATSLAPAYRFAAALDGSPAAVDRVALTFTNLTGPVGLNATIDARESLVFAWTTENTSRDLHRLEIAAPAQMHFRLRAGGSLEIAAFESLVPATLSSDRSKVEGRTIEYPAVVVLRERAGSTAAIVLVVLAIVVPAGLVAWVAAWTSRKIQVKETPLPVEPRYK